MRDGSPCGPRYARRAGALLCAPPLRPRGAFAELVAPAPPDAGAPHEHGFAMLGAPGDFLVRRKSPKTHQEPPGSWTSGEGGLAPFDPPASCPSGIGCGNLNRQASSEASLPRHGLTAEGVTPGRAWGEIKTDLPTQLKVANRSGFVAESSPGASGSAAPMRADVLHWQGPGAQPRHAFGSFRRETKGTPGVGRVGPPMGVVGAFGPHLGSAEGRSPSQDKEATRGRRGRAIPQRGVF